MNQQEEVERLKERLAQDGSLSAKNRHLILTFVERCSADGIKSKRQKKYLYGMKGVANMLKMDMDKATKEDLQKLVAKINTSSLAEWTKHDYKVAIKKFYKVMEGHDDDPDFIPEKVRWLKTTMKEEEFMDPNHVLRADEVDKIVAST